MEVIATQLKPSTFDPVGAMRSGMELANLGLQPMRIAQELRQAQLAEAEAARALEMRRFEDTARKTLADIAKRNTTRGPDGRLRVDRKATVAEAKAAGLDPTFLNAYESQQLANEATSIRTVAERVKFFNDKIDEQAQNITRQLEALPKDTPIKERDAVASKLLNDYAVSLAKASNEPLAQVQDTVIARTGMENGMSISMLLSKLAEARSISPLQERELIASGVGADDVNPRSAASQAARQFVASQGMQVPEGISLAQMRNDPRYKTIIAAFDKQVTGVIPGEGARVEGVREAAEAGAARTVYQDALLLEGRYNTAITRPGATIEDILARVITQPAERSRIEGAIADYNTRNPDSPISLRDGAPSVFARLRQQDNKFKALQTSGADVAGATNLRDVAREKVPKDVQANRDLEATNTIRSEYDTRVRELRAKPNDRSLQADVDALARELRAKKVSVPGASDILRGVRAEPPKATGIRLKRLSDGRTVIAPSEDRARAAIASGKFERL